MAHILTFSATGALEVNNGLAYAAVAGGATGYIPEEFKWFGGANHTAHLAMTLSRGIDLVAFVAVTSIRAAITEALANHANELGDIVTGNALRLNAAEVMDEATCLLMIARGRLTADDWLAQNDRAAAAPGQPHANDWVPAVTPVRIREQINSSDMRLWATGCARMTYTILAVNGMGLVSMGHHYTGPMVNVGQNTAKLYQIDQIAKNLGQTVKEILGVVFHHSLHPLSYEHVANWVMNIPAGAAAKLAATATKRMPVYPGGVQFVKNALTVWRQVAAAEELAALCAVLVNAPAHLTLIRLNAAIIANVLDFSSQFRPAAFTARSGVIQRVVPYVCSLFGIYEEWLGIRTKAGGEGPTRGPGMVKMVDENRAAFMKGVHAAEAAIGIFSNNAPVRDANGWAAELATVPVLSVAEAVMIP
jgi:hypothetical protein